MKRGKRINPVGARGRQDKVELDQALIVVEARSHGWCEMIGCNRRAAVLHHVGRRSRTYGPVRNDPANLMHLCNPCHRAIHDDEVWARERGYLR